MTNPLETSNEVLFKARQLAIETFKTLPEDEQPIVLLGLILQKLNQQEVMESIKFMKEVAA